MGRGSDPVTEAPAELPELSLDDASLVLSTIADVVERMEDRELDERDTSSPLPRGIFTCGEASIVVRAALILIVRAYPDLRDPAVLETSLRSVVLSNFAGRRN